MTLHSRFLAGALSVAALLPASHLLAQTAPDTESQDSVTPLTPAQFYAKLDPQMAEVIDVFNLIKGTPLVKLTPQDARQQFAAQDAEKIIARASQQQLAPMPVGRIIDGTIIPGSDGNEIPVRIYKPRTPGKHPVILYFHGGGFVVATIDTYDSSARALCNFADAIVVSVEYRKAPEHPYPAALHDAISSYKWAISHSGNYDGLEDKVAVVGESAGGNLAAEVALAARDENLRRPTAEVLIYPETTSNLNQQSDILFENAVPLNTAALYYFDGFYRPASEANQPGVAPINADLHHLPPTTIIAAELDPLQSDGHDYAVKLAREGNPVDYRLYKGVTHEFFGMGAVVDKALLAEQFAAAQLKQSFETK